MNKKIVIDISADGFNTLLREVEDKQKWLNEKTQELCKRLADMGVVKAEAYFSNAVYDGIYDFEVHADPIEGGYVVKASGEKILFIEFGSGLIGYGHPEPNDYGPGTYPGKGHWKDPQGWWYKNEDGSGHHSYGNPPNMPMYKAVTGLEQELARVVKEVFAK